ncbi:MAG TPA: amidase domain-containing protein [Agromyces sp.]|nr:amidase domain-containing protein [Agromyces sp.]
MPVETAKAADLPATGSSATGGSAGRHPRHRAEHVRNRRSSSGMFRRSVALGCATAIMGVSAFGAIAASATADRATTSTALTGAETGTTTLAADTIEPRVAPDVEPAVTSGLSVAAAPFTGGTQVTVTGQELDEVAAVTVGGAPATIVALDEGQVTFAVPAVADSALGSAVEVAFADASGQPIDVETPTASVAAGASPVQPLEGELTGEAVAPVPTTPRSLTLTYTSDPAIDAQVSYVLTYWSSYNSAQYPVLTGYDCANFASQSLVARGWAMDGGWYLDGGTGAMSPSWASSTALRDYLSSRPDRATPLDDSQRALVKVGDIAQFDWDDSGDRDHTAVVTRVERSATGTKIWVGGHTKDADYWDVDTALATGGGSVTYFSIR